MFIIIGFSDICILLFEIGSIFILCNA